MSILKNLANDSVSMEEKDVVNAGGPLDSGIYACEIKLAYTTIAASGANGLVLQAKTKDGQIIKETIWLTSGTAKGGKSYYEKDGQKFPLPGYLTANAIALLTTGKDISNLDTEPKIVNVYSYEAKKEVPTKVEMVMDLVGTQILLAVIKENVDKNVKNDSGVYVPSGETRFQNTIDKVFRATDRKTTTEVRAEADADFYDAWKAKWDGQVKNKATKSTGAAGAPGQPAIKKPTSSLFA